ncbi:ATP-binding protein, partial [Thermodesulfobacteriota bacterium]
EGFYFDQEHQTIIPVPGGLYSLQYEYVTLLDEGELLKQRVDAILMKVRRILRGIEEQTDAFMNQEVLKSEVALARAWRTMVFIWFGMALVILGVSYHIVMAIRKQIQAIEATNRELDAKSRDLESAYEQLREEMLERMQAEEDKSKMEGQLRQVQKVEAIGTLAGGIAHDFNNILTAIIGYADMAKDDVPEDTETRDFLEQIMTAGNRARDLVEHILTFSRETEGEMSPISLQPVLATIPSTIEIRRKIHGSRNVILADPTHIHQIVMNLCTNALHAMEETGGVLEIELSEVEISAHGMLDSLSVKPGNFVLLRVSDTGVGMTQTVKERIFDPYFTTKEVGKGTGMGLAVIHGILRSYGGMINVESEEGKGSTFYVYFPMVDEEVVSRIEKAGEIPKGTETVLVVDDEPSVAQLATKMLERLGYTVIASTSSKMALGIFRSAPEAIDLVLSDQTMPEMTGVELAEELLKIRCMSQTGYSDHSQYRIQQPD